MTSKTETPETGSVLRVLVVADSAYVRIQIREALAESGDIEVVGHAADGKEAVRLTQQLRPDIITLDPHMLRVDSALLSIWMGQQPTFVIFVSTDARRIPSEWLDREGTDAVELPDRGPFSEAIRGEILQKVRRTRGLVRLGAGPEPLPSIPTNTPSPAPERDAPRSPLRHLVVVSGPRPSVKEILSHVPGDLAAAMLITVDVPAKFLGALVHGREAKYEIAVSVAEDGDLLLERHAYFCPPHSVTEVKGGLRSRAGVLADLRIRVRPPPETETLGRLARLSWSVAELAGPLALGVALARTEGHDVEDMRFILGAGGTILVETDETGNPRDAEMLARAGALREVEDAMADVPPRFLKLPLPAILQFLAKLA